MTKGEIINSVMARFDYPIRVLEIGRIRSTSLANERGDGWSTLWFALNCNVNILYSIDNNPATEKVCATFPALQDERIVYAPSVEDLGEIDPIDLLYLDAEDDAEATVGHFRSVEGNLADGAIVLIDDVYECNGVKGDMLIPLLKDAGWEIEAIGPMAIARGPDD